MGEHLVFLLHAPLGAMGGVAVGERRAGFDRPGKSAILGLIAAGLGLDRSDESAHTALADGYGLGLGEIAPGCLLFDYHTAQMPPQRKNRRFATRREELGVDDVGTILSVREYRTDPAYLVVLWPREAHRAGSTRSVCRRPEAPTFHALFRPQGVPVGRASRSSRNCRSRRSAFGLSDLYVAGTDAGTDRSFFSRSGGSMARRRFWRLDLDARKPRDRARIAMRIERRRDALESRRRWQFGLRSEAVVDGRRE